jgi:hypothetical protein
MESMMLNDGDEGEFITYIIWDEVTVQWSWIEPEDYEMDGCFDIFVFKDGLDITYDIPKLHFKWIEAEVKEYAGYEPPSHQRVASVINSYFNKTF